MSEFKIKNGVGNGDLAKVNSVNRLVTESISTDVSLPNLLNGKVFALASGLITSTNTTEIPLLFFSHSESNEILWGRRMILWSSESVGSAINTAYLKFYIGATGIVGGSDFTPISSSISTSNTLDGTFQRGAMGATLTGGTNVTTHIIPLGEPYKLDFNALYNKGTSLAVTLVPPTGNTSLDLSYLIQTELINPENY